MINNFHFFNREGKGVGVGEGEKGETKTIGYTKIEY